MINETFIIWKEYTTQKANINTGEFTDNQEVAPREREIWNAYKLQNWDEYLMQTYN